MNIADSKENYNYFTGKASEIVRQLCLAGFALLWAFKPSAGQSSIVFSELKIPVSILAVALVLDIAQYVFGALLWWWRVRRHERANGTTSDEPVPVTWCGNLAIDVPFVLKILATMIGYVWMAGVLIRCFLFTG